MISGPEVLFDEHDRSQFDCGEQTLNEWLIRRSLKNQQSGASRAYVICKENRVIAYYALASGSIERLIASKTIARNMPDPIPVTVLGRLAVDLQYQGQRFGAALLKDAILRTVSVSRSIGVRAILVHAITEDAKRFYANYGFKESPINKMTLMLSLQQIKTHF